jgi:hypothetical protein
VTVAVHVLLRVLRQHRGGTADKRHGHQSPQEGLLHR